MPNSFINAFADALRSEHFDRATQILRDHPELRSLSAFPFDEPWVVSFVSSGPPSALEFLLDQGFPPDVTDDIGRTPLQLAVEHGSAQCVKLLLKYGADPNVRDPILGSLLLEKAVGTGDTAIVRLLLEAGSPMYCSMNTILHRPPDNLANFEQVLNVLLEYGFDIDHEPRDSWCALGEAAWSGNVPLAKLLLKHGANPNSGSSRLLANPLCLGIASLNPEVVRTLLEAGATPHVLWKDFQCLWDNMTKSPGEYVKVMAVLRSHGVLGQASRCSQAKRACRRRRARRALMRLGHLRFPSPSLLRGVGVARRYPSLPVMRRADARRRNLWQELRDQVGDLDSEIAPRPVADPVIALEDWPPEDILDFRPR